MGEAAGLPMPAAAPAPAALATTAASATGATATRVAAAGAAQDASAAQPQEASGVAKYGVIAPSAPASTLVLKLRRSTCASSACGWVSG